MGLRKITRRFGCTCPNCASGLNSRTKKRQHVCHYTACGKVYGKVSDLRVHLRWHTGERPFLCPWLSCGKKFPRSDEMQRHLRTHTGEKRFQCNECGKRFIRSDHLNQHIKTHRKNYRVHTGEKRFQCNECEKRYKRSDHLNRHIKMHRKNHRVHVGEVDTDLTCWEEDLGMFDTDLTCWEEDLGMFSPDSESSPIASVPSTAPAFIDTNAPSSSMAMQGVASSYPVSSGLHVSELPPWLSHSLSIYHPALYVDQISYSLT